MRLRRFTLALLLAVPIAIGSGCLKSVGHAAATSAAPGTPIIQLHWMGTRALASETNPAPLQAMMQLPQAAKLRDQIFTKLSQYPWLNASGTSSNQTGSALLLPLLRALASNEGYLEMNSEETVLAIRSGERDGSLWRTNLPAVLKAWPGVTQADNNGPLVLQQGSRKLLITTERQSDWLVLGIGPEKRVMLPKVREKIAAGLAPFKSGPTNYWLEATIDLARFEPWLQLEAPFSTHSPIMHLTAIGEGEYVRTDASFSFDRPLNLVVEPWAIPTNVIHEPLVSFTAARGFRSLLSEMPLVQEFKPKNLPNQAFTWTLGVGPMLAFAAMPMPDAASWLDSVAPRLLLRVNRWLKENKGEGQANWETNTHTLKWIPVPLLNPALQAVRTPDAELLVGRLGPAPVLRGDPPPAELLSRITSSQDLVYYDWEVTEPRLGHWLFISQSARVSFDRAQIGAKAPSLEFLLAAKSKMGNCVTDVRQTGPATLSLVRKSHSGFSGVEWHLIADWVESPLFPKGLHSLLKHGSGLPTYREFLQPPRTNPPARK